jgi:hypothetical protein
MTFSPFRPACAVVAIITTLAVSIPAQKADRNKAILQAQPPAGSTKNQERALVLIDLILSASGRFADDRLRLKTQNQIAETLWDYDKARARRLFEEVFRGTDSLVIKVGQGGFSHSAPDLVNPLRFEMRKEILQAVSTRDGELAERLAASIQGEQPYRKLDPATAVQLAIDRELVEHNLAVALNIVQSDPQRAARLARDSLGRIISYGFTRLIRSMRVSNPNLADQLFLDALAAVQRKPTYISNKIGILAPYVFPEIKQEQDNYSNERINADLVSRFLDLVYDVLTRVSSESQVNESSPFGTNSFDESTLRAILPHFEKQSGERAAVVRSLLDDIVKKINQAGRKDMFDREDEAWGDLFKSNVAELIRSADASKIQEQKDELYSNAAFLLAQRDGDFDKALPVIEKISDQRTRTYILTMLRTGATSLAIRNGETERAYRYASEMTDLNEQIRLFQEIALSLIDKKETRRAAEVVSECARLAQHLSEETSKAAVLLSVAGIASRLNPVKGFEVLQSAVEAINRASFGPHWGEQTTYKVTKANERPQVISEVSGLEDLEFGKCFSALARTDFDKALALAKAIRLNEASLLAQLAVCRGVLTSPIARH